MANPTKVMKSGWIVLILFAMVFAGCSNNAGNDDKATPADNQSTQVDQSSGKSEAPLTYTIAVKRKPSTAAWSEMKEVNAFLKEANIQVKWQEIPSSGWDEKVNLLFASGDMPDAVLGGVSDNVILKNKNAILPLNDLLEKYAPNLSKFLGQRQDVKRAVTAPDGNIYGFFYMSEYIDDMVRDKLMVNKKWLDQANLKVPTTTDEFYNMLKTFKETDMNGNGQHDEIPFTFSMDDEDTNMYSMFGAFGVLDNPDHVMVKNGKVLFSPSLPEYKEALQYFHRLYAEGLIDQAAFSQTVDQYESKGKTEAPTIGSMIEYVPEDLVGGDRGPDYVGVKPLKGPEGAQLWNVTDKVPIGLSKNLLVLNKKVKNPEGLVRFVDYLNSTEVNVLRASYGQQGVTWDYVNGNTIKKLQDSVPEGMTYSKFIGTYRDTLPVIKTYDMNSRLENTDVNVRRDEMIRAIMPYLPKEFVSISAYADPAELQERTTLLTDIDKYVRSFMSNAIINGIDDAGWQKHLDSLKKLKTDRYVELLQSYYDKNKLEDGIKFPTK